MTMSRCVAVSNDWSMQLFFISGKEGLGDSIRRTTSSPHSEEKLS